MGAYVIASLLLTRIETSLQDRTVILPLTVHRLVLTAVVLAAKVHDDIHASNTHFAQVGGIPVAEPNKLERTFLQYIGYRTVVSPEEYANCKFSLDSLYASMSAVVSPQMHNPLHHPQHTKRPSVVVQKRRRSSGCRE